MMNEQYRYERCRKLATEVHHIKPIQTKEGKKMKLKQIVCDGTTLNLIKEKKVIEYGEVFEVSEETDDIEVSEETDEVEETEEVEATEEVTE